MLYLIVFVYHHKIRPSLCYPIIRDYLLRLLPRQRLNTIYHILERLLILLGRIRRSLRALDFRPIIPLHFKRRQDDTGIKAIDIFIRVAGEPLQLSNEREELVDVIAAENSIKVPFFFFFFF